MWTVLVDHLDDDKVLLASLLLLELCELDSMTMKISGLAARRISHHQSSAQTAPHWKELAHKLFDDKEVAKELRDLLHQATYALSEEVYRARAGTLHRATIKWTLVVARYNNTRVEQHDQRKYRFPYKSGELHCTSLD